MMDLHLTDREVIEEALYFLGEKDYPEATTLLWKLVEAAGPVEPSGALWQRTKDCEDAGG
jgi:hypothetical protein